MKQTTRRKHAKPPTCDVCGEPLETAATSQNPSATVRAHSLARCPACLLLFVVGADLRPSPDP